MPKDNLLFRMLRHSGRGCLVLGEMMGKDNVVLLRPTDRPVQDMDQIAAIYRSLGPVSAEQVVTRALGELAFSMSSLADRVREHELSDLVKRLKRLQKMAENLGLITLADVAMHLADCVQRSDSTAFSAVWARLCRVAENTLSPDVRQFDQSS